MIKDESTGTWYDQFGSNFKVPLQLALTSMAFDEDDDDVAPAQLPDSELPELPTELCGIWAYIKWETAGCPQRNQAESDAEYQKAIEARISLRQKSMSPLSAEVSGSCSYGGGHRNGRSLPPKCLPA